MKFLYMEVANNSESQKKAWSKFESRFPSLTGRKMYGLDYDSEKIYRVCSLVLDSDNGETFGLKQFEFEGKTHIRLRLKFPTSELFKKIGPAYGFLINQYKKEINWSLPMIEHYKTNNILDIMIPINN
jgi:hypothetical protein